MVIEEVGRPPVDLLALIFIAKPDGGRRPIGLLTGLMRLWGQVRRGYGREWEVAHSRSYFWAGQGRPAADSAHQQTLKAEVARARGQESASTLLDMVKCYEKIQHVVVIEAARRTGFPLRVVRLCLAIYAGRRVISVDGALTKTFRLGTSIVAGCAFATTLLRVVLLECLDMGCKLYPQVSFYVYVDDIDIGACGDEADVISDTFGATRLFVYALEHKVKATVSREKSMVLGSSAHVRDALADRLAPMFLKVGTKGKKLGTDFTLGSRRVCATLKKGSGSAGSVIVDLRPCVRPLAGPKPQRSTRRVR